MGFAYPDAAAETPKPAFSFCLPAGMDAPGGKSIALTSSANRHWLQQGPVQTRPSLPSALGWRANQHPLHPSPRRQQGFPPDQYSSAFHPKVQRFCAPMNSRDL